MTERDDRLRYIRLSKGLSRKGLAKDSKVSVSVIKAIEKGDTTHPHPETMAKLAAALQKNITDIKEFRDAIQEEH